MFEALKVAPSEPKAGKRIANEMKDNCRHCNRMKVLVPYVAKFIKSSIDNKEKLFEICGRHSRYGNMYRLHARIRKKNKYIRVGAKILNFLFWLVGLIVGFGYAVLWILKKAGLDLN